MSVRRRKPDFLIIGAQKSGTSWLWDKLDQHLEKDLPDKKGIHYFGGVENYWQGPDWSYAHFDECDSKLITGEASTAYLFDRMPYWFNAAKNIEYEPDLLPIPDLVAKELPEAKIIAVLRDPVYRALSAYRHWMKQGDLPPLLGLQGTAVGNPKTRILEYGYYAQYLAAWKAVYPDTQLLLLLFEDDVVGNPESGLRKLYDFLGIDSQFVPQAQNENVHKSWSWTRGAFSYYAGPLRKYINRSRIGAFLDRYDFLERFAVRISDIKFLRQTYLAQKEPLEALLGHKLDIWDYGQKLLNKISSGTSRPAGRYQV